MTEITIRISTDEDSGTLLAAWDDPRGGGLSTQGETLSELENNIRDAVSLHFDEDEQPKQVRLHFTDDPVLAAA